MDLRQFTVDEPPPSRSRRAWEQRFEEILEQGLAGQWINASRAWGLKATNSSVAARAGERCGLTVDVRSAGGQLYLRVK